MKLEHSVTVGAPIEVVWAWLMDVPRIATCVPGVASVEAIADDKFRGTIKVQVGPIRLSLNGDVWILERDEAAHSASMQAEASDRAAGGGVKAVLTVALTELAPNSTEMRMGTDAQILGRIGDFGLPIIRKKADQVVGDFARNLQAAIQAHINS